MKIFNLFFDINERKENTGWSMTHKDNMVRLVSRLYDGSVATTLLPDENTKLYFEETGMTDLDIKFLHIVPGFKTATISLMSEPNSNYVVYIKAQEGKKISAIKTDCSSVVLNYISPDRTEISLVVIPEPNVEYQRIRVYQNDKKVLSIQNGGFRIAQVEHEIKDANNLKPQVYLQLQPKMLLTSDVTKIPDFIDKQNYTLANVALFLLTHKTLDVSLVYDYKNRCLKDNVHFAVTKDIIESGALALFEKELQEATGDSCLRLEYQVV